VSIFLDEPIKQVKSIVFSFENTKISIDSVVAESKKIDLFFQPQITVNKPEKLTISGITDIYGNILPDTVIILLLSKANPYDIVITEIMADPEPVVELPPFEYLELYNKCTTSVDLMHWQLAIGSRKIILPRFTLPANEYLLITSKDAEKAYKSIKNALFLLSNYVLNNEGNTITLKDSTGQLIAMTSYSNQSYNSNFKEKGGWSLELVDTKNPCGIEENWLPSNARKGGTPGYENSVKNNNPDNNNPELHYAQVPNDSSLILNFSEIVDSANTIILANYYLSPSIGNPLSVSYFKNTFSSINLRFDKKIKPNITYTLKMNNSICDCVGNKLNTKEAPIALPLIADSAEIIINEILFNPYPYGSEFVELVNISNKAIDAGRLVLATVDTVSGEIENYCKIAPEGFSLFPGQYLVVTNRIAGLEQFYNLKNKNVISEQPDFPSLNDKQGIVALLDKSESTIDKIRYNENQQFILLNSKEGVSLERINPKISGMSSSNWHSASQSNGFATPGYENSQMKSSVENINESVKISPEVFTPDNDGIDDFMQISIEPENPGVTASITIFSSSGVPVKRLIKNEYLGATNTYTWDGTSDEPKLQPSGIYIVFTRVVSDKGEVKEFKNICVLGYR
jgi:hypothetical protein